jgi:hypothetical protein
MVAGSLLPGQARSKAALSPFSPPQMAFQKVESFRQILSRDTILHL